MEEWLRQHLLYKKCGGNNLDVMGLNPRSGLIWDA